MKETKQLFEVLLLEGELLLITEQRVVENSALGSGVHKNTIFKGPHD